jgi:hypothetical protein
MFIRTAAMDGMAEVEHGRLAAQNAAHDEVKQFAQRMVDDHSKAGDELKGLASQKNVTLPTALDPAHSRSRAKHCSRLFSRPRQAGDILRRVESAAEFIHHAAMIEFRADLTFQIFWGN